MHEQSDDLAVIQMVLQGQQAAFAKLVDKYQAYVFTLVLRYVDNREIAEELAQDIFVKAYRFLADFKGSSKFSTWLFTIVNSTCLSHLRKKTDGTVLLEEEKMILLSDSQSVADPAERMEQRTTQQMLANAMKHLSDQDRILLTLFYQGEQSVEEIGVILAQSASNVKVRLFRARQKLKEILETRYNEELTS